MRSALALDGCDPGPGELGRSSQANGQAAAEVRVAGHDESIVRVPAVSKEFRDCWPLVFDLPVDQASQRPTPRDLMSAFHIDVAAHAGNVIDLLGSGKSVAPMQVG